MRKHGWELPYHPLQVVAVAVFLALAFAFYVFFVPFVGRKVFQYIVIGCFSPLVTSVFGLYIWCAATDPGDPGVFRSKKYGKIPDLTKGSSFKEPLPGSAASVDDTNTESVGEKLQPEGPSVTALAINEPSNLDQKKGGCKDLCTLICAWFPLTWMLKSSCSRKQSSEQHMCEDDMLYCSLCEVEVFKYSKHCRVCDKCVDGFDHHCRWLNNCIGRKNYNGFFALMVSALLLLILQWSIGILVLVCCFLNRSRFDVEIISKLGSSFSLVPFIVVVGSCTVLAMVATLPLAQLFFFHILLIKKGISTYDYIIAMREQEQQTMGGAQSPQMSPASSATALSSASSASALHRGAWCTPPRLFLEDQFNVLPPEGVISSIETGNRSAKRMSGEQTGRRNNVVKISPWTLARLNAEEVSKAAAQARKKSKVLQPIPRQEGALGVDTDNSSLASSSRDRSTGITLQHDNRRRSYRRARPQSPLKSFPFTRPLRPAKLPLKCQAKSEHLCEYDDVDINHTIGESSARLAPLQFEARNAFRSSLAVASGGAIGSSPESSLASPDIQPFRESTSSIHDISGVTAAPPSFPKGLRLLRSTSDGYEASAGESPDDSDHASARLQKPNWNNLLFNPTYTDKHPATGSSPNQMSIFPYRESKLKSTSQARGLRMQVSNERGVMRKLPEGSHPTEEINYSPSRYDSPERDSESFSSKQSKDKFIRKGDTA